jgi:hypothetical protein
MVAAVRFFNSDFGYGRLGVMLPHWPPEIWFGFATAVAAVGYLFVSYRMWQLQKAVEDARSHIDLAIELGRGEWDKDGLQIHNQDWIEVINSSPTGVRVKAITIKAEREDRTTQKLTQPANELIKRFSKERINIYWMSAVVGPLTPKGDKNIFAKGRVTIILEYTAYGKTSPTEPYEFTGEFGHGVFFELRRSTEVELQEPPPTQPS